MILILRALCFELIPPKRYLDSKLNSGNLTAPRSFRLVLLRSRPDTVHRFLPRKTRISTPLNQGSFDKKSPLHSITPTIADCRYKVPLPPRLHETTFYMVLVELSTDADCFCLRNSKIIVKYKEVHPKATNSCRRGEEISDEDSFGGYKCQIYPFQPSCL